MSNRDFVYRNSRPSLVVENAGGAQLGNCYTASYFKVTALHALSMEKLRLLFDVGVLGSGQSFTAVYITAAGTKERVPEKLTWQDKVEATGNATVPCVTVERHTNKVLDEPANNPYSGKPYEPIQMPYYVYECETRCDSGD